MHKQEKKPDSTHIELAIIGNALNGYEIDRIMDIIKPEFFENDKCKVIFSCLKERYLEEKPFDKGLICEDLKKTAAFSNSQDIFSFLMICDDYARIVTDLDEYLTILKDEYKKREVSKIAMNVQKMAIDASNEFTDIISYIQSEMISLENDRELDCMNLHEIHDVYRGVGFEKFVSDQMLRYQQGIEFTGISTGFKSLDEVTKGFSPGSLIFIGARSGTGKSTIVNQLCYNMIMNNHSLAYFSLEMSYDQIYERIIGLHANVTHKRFKSGKITHEHLNRLVGSKNDFKNKNMHIFEMHGASIEKIYSKARQAKNIKNVEAIVIDHLSAITTDSRKSSRYEEMVIITRTLKTIASKLQIPVICISQLNRKQDERVNKKPALSDLRDSGSIEQDSDMIILLNRPDYYDPMDRPGQLELLIEKNRDFDKGVVRLIYNSEIDGYEEMQEVRF